MNKNTSIRLKELIGYFGINQEEFAKRTGIPKSAVSMYCSGQRTPRQDRLTDISEAFNVSEAWLMGFDVPMNKSDAQKRAEFDHSISMKLNRLSEADKKLVLDLIDSLLAKYNK